MSGVLTSVVAWEDRLAIRRTIVLFVTLWMTWRAFDWAATYATTTALTSGLEAGLIMAAVTAPVTYLQKVVFESYIKAKDKE